MTTEQIEQKKQQLSESDLEQVSGGLDGYKPKPKPQPDRIIENPREAFEEFIKQHGGICINQK